jgi:flagellar hook-basal body complex protein FliE
MDIRTSLAAQVYAAARPATETKSAPGGPADAFARAAASFSETLARGEGTAREAMMGRADPHSLVTALAESQLAIETAVTVRDRVVEAYQEILRMQV